MRTLLLDITNWDLVTDVNGNIAVADDPLHRVEALEHVDFVMKGGKVYKN